MIVIQFIAVSCQFLKQKAAALMSPGIAQLLAFVSVVSAFFRKTLTIAMWLINFLYCGFVSEKWFCIHGIVVMIAKIRFLFKYLKCIYFAEDITNL